MDVRFACIAGGEIYRQWGPLCGQDRRVAPRSTPFGDSHEIFLVDDRDCPYYLLPRHGTGMRKMTPRDINNRANLFALKDMGVDSILAWGPGGAITHDVAVGDLIVLSDVADRTTQREGTFFEESPLGFLRPFPVFCPALRHVAAEVLHDLGLHYHDGGAAAVSEGPRMETRSEIRILAHVGIDYVTHTFVPEVFLAKELQMCYAAILYVVNYAETGSRHRPFASGGLFGGLTEIDEAQRLARSLGSMGAVVDKMAQAAGADSPRCGCDQPMAGQIDAYDLSSDWRKWFANGSDA
ncbi:hypothetical protein LCGC14_0226510 [marine sediment metagenome]|uniref:Nucleoside phosphorylase domain-containing protein n=1 Tax=marine sediment metagenome TaxID=412755 RepID=A0A0F9XFS5_9ZZZZ|nr:phosphorylase [Phycisphaerae bacterium]HDZ44510.1 phosphorylase [Phycisphaerae bacterium]